jgi:hypothetical protein
MMAGKTVPAALPAQGVPASLQARLYPLNEIAGGMGPLTVTLTDDASGHANFALTRGMYVNCEYALTASNRGAGACLFSNGAKYQVHFGT